MPSPLPFTLPEQLTSLAQVGFVAFRINFVVQWRVFGLGVERHNLRRFTNRSLLTGVLLVGSRFRLQQVDESPRVSTLWTL